MKKTFLLLIVLNFYFFSVINSQTIIVTDDPTYNTGQASSVFDVKSISKGMLVPRMDSSQRVGISSPATGLLVYQTDGTNGFWYFNGVQWISLTAGLTGATGPTGPTGEQGITGPTGPTGADGSLNAWALLGNTGTTQGTNFLGTTDSKYLSIRTNNTERFRVTNQGQLEVFNTGMSVFMGQSAGRVDDLTDNENVFIGYLSGFSNTSGDANVGIGAQALNANTSGNRNTALGKYALKSNGSGSNNTSIGSNALTLNTSGSHNVAIGSSALQANISGQKNVAIGTNSSLNTTSSSNTAVGAMTLNSNTSGALNTAIGESALYTNVTGSRNIATGFQTLFNSTGSDNLANGCSALYTNTSGDKNSAVGGYSLYSNTTGVYNTAVGYQSLYTNTVGSYNTAIGEGSDVSNNNLSYATVIGCGATVNASNKVRIGGTGVTVIEGQVDWSFPSDGRFKYNINENVKGLDFITQLRPVTYQFDARKFDEFLMKNMSEKERSERMKSIDYSPSMNIVHSGFIAQEVVNAAKKCGYNFNGVHIPDNDNDNFSISYGQFVVPLIKSVQELKKTIDEQNQVITEQGKKIEKLQSKLDQITR